MSMIISVLLKVLRKAVFYFQYDSLWKNLKVTSNVGRTHDVYDQKGVSLKRGKCCRLFSTGYGQENEASCAAFLYRTHDLDDGKVLKGQSAVLRDLVCY